MDFKNRVMRELEHVALARRIYYFDETGSTSDWAKSFVITNGAEGDLHGTVVVARNQTSGRGRFNRKWHGAPGKSLMFSVIVCHEAQTAVAACVAACEAIRETSQLQVALKYPNDIMFKGRKLSGILIERVQVKTRTFYVIGIGVNVNHARHELPADTRIPATSLLVETGRCIDPALLLKNMLLKLQCSLTDSAERCMEKLNLLCDTVGKIVEVRQEEGVLTGTAMGLDSDGVLLLRTASGETLRVTAGEVFQVNQ